MSQAEETRTKQLLQTEAERVLEALNNMELTLEDSRDTVGADYARALDDALLAARREVQKLYEVIVG
jgi:exonuclease VII small subunit